MAGGGTGEGGGGKSKRIGGRESDGGMGGPPPWDEGDGRGGRQGATGPGPPALRGGFWIGVHQPTAHEGGPLQPGGVINGLMVKETVHCSKQKKERKPRGA